ncbi:TetR/AcrR family transcriptional regulator [Allostreptomyces psammosilenae]|uniref:AcrR family transcriptional regulator n=1 Tax=Allostreptomyces psammosilenae TaxID=1892865 RepID=A0A852ZXJ8_9ACTN|nr:TetR/AcrR family transcriptional regulator [Allostreptomyces psammosilenae]NYI03361.1 AcrR family transcriptional regulator [Allostreptomyces psammosilenae]
MPKGPTKRRPETVARLLEAALDAFAERGVHGVTIEELCERAGFTRGAFYSNFRSKDELLWALFDAYAERAVTRAGALLTAMDEAADPISALIDASRLDDPEERRWYLVTTEINLYAMRDPDVARALAAHEDRLREKIAALLAVAFERAGVRPAVDLHQLARLLVAIREGGQAQSYVQPERYPPGDLERTFLPLILEAVTAGKRGAGDGGAREG